MSATHVIESTTTTARVLYLALELGNTSWKLAFTIGAGQKPRIRTIPARQLAMLLDEIAKAKQKLRLPEDTPVISCYEAGRDGFWLHRFLAHHRVENLIVDAASIEVNRRQRRAKSDNLDATKLVGMLIRWHLGEKKLWGRSGHGGVRGGVRVRPSSQGAFEGAFEGAFGSDLVPSSRGRSGQTWGVRVRPSSQFRQDGLGLGSVRSAFHAPSGWPRGEQPGFSSK